MTTFMIRYKTMEWFDLQTCKKSCTNGSRELINISCKHILSTSGMYICRGSQNIRYYRRWIPLTGFPYKTVTMAAQKTPKIHLTL